MTDEARCVALTGATGFVGRHVLRQLLTSGYRVRALCRDRGRLGVADARVKPIEGSLFNQNSLTELVTGADAVIHLVGIIMENRSAGQTFERVHVDGTSNLLEAAKQAGGIRKWVHMSALGWRPNAASTYHATKWKAERLVRASGLDCTIFRPSIIHGPDGEFMQMVKDFWCGLFPPIVPYFGAGPFGLGGAGKLQPVYVEDVAECFVKALDNARAKNETYPMGGPDEYTWPGLYKTVKKHLPKARNKCVVAVPVWKAKLLAKLPGAPFNTDQVIMSQENSTCGTAKVENDFEIELKPFEATLAEYASQI